MKANHIRVSKTARYYTEGDLNKNTKVVVFLLHGYGQTALSMMKSCAGLKSDSRFLIAPEGLSRFYWEQFSGKVVASWMTSDDRETEISDYTRYLNKLYDQVQSISPDCKMICLGFSQGVATGTRWVSRNQRKFQKIISIAGAPAKEIDWNDPTDPINSIPHLYIVGNDDRWIDEKAIDRTRAKFDATGLNFEIEIFEGDHSINDEATAIILQHL
ncbi:MAG: hypothetical protein HKN92_04810 [Chitinophagales bacterium]|nr:hypothetical protein [Chitinophagales bacterium]